MKSAIGGENAVGFRRDDLREPDLKSGAVEINRRVLVRSTENSVERSRRRLMTNEAVPASAAPCVTLAEHRDGVGRRAVCATARAMGDGVSWRIGGVESCRGCLKKVGVMADVG